MTFDHSGTTLTVERVSLPWTRPDLHALLIPGERRPRALPTGARMIGVFLTGRRRHDGFTLPPDVRDRLVLGVWTDEAAARHHLDEGRGARWSEATECFSALVRPLSARGSWVDRGVLSALSARPGRGPLAVLTYGTVRLRDRPRWFLKDEPRAAAHIRTSPGLVRATGGASGTLRTVATASFWSDERAMVSAAYGKAGQHRAQLEAWRPRVRDLCFVRGEVLETRGTWGGEPLDELQRADAAGGPPVRGTAG